MKYTYKGTFSGATIKTGKEEKEYIFVNGKEYDLPENNEYVKTLVARKHLIPSSSQAQKTTTGKES